jgi:hypothetical protein
MKEAIGAGPLSPATPAAGRRRLNVSVHFMDKLGERLAFERSGVRLYNALIAKLDLFGSWPGGPTRVELESIRDDELTHFLLLNEVIRRLGGDPAAVTPSADLVDLTAMGLRQALGDPRTNLLQSLEAILIAELVDRECWGRLIELAHDTGPALVAAFEEAHQQEEAHLARVRAWVLSSGADPVPEASRHSPPICPAVPGDQD